MSAGGLDDCISGGLALIKKPHAADKDNGCAGLLRGVRKGRSYARSPEIAEWSSGPATKG